MASGLDDSLIRTGSPLEMNNDDSVIPTVIARQISIIVLVLIPMLRC